MASCNNNPDSYTLKGDLEGLNDQTIYLERIVEDRFQKVDSTTSKNGKFTFKGEVSVPQQFFITFKKQPGEIAFFGEASRMSLSGKTDSLEYVTIEGSATHDQFQEYQTKMMQLRNQQRTIYYAYQEAARKQQMDQVAMYEHQYIQLDSLRNAYGDKFIEDHPASVISAYIALRSAFNYELDELKNIVEGFHPSISASYYVEQLNNHIEKLEQTSIGQIAPDFTQNDVDGNPVSLSDFRGQYVLIDFWAAWCSPCRAENPNVVNAYKKYHDKGFTVLGVSLDKNRKDWEEAIEKDGLIWTQVSDLKGWDNEVSNYYGVMSIPQNFLLDRKGVIIAKNVRGEKLQTTLAAIFD